MGLTDLLKRDVELLPSDDPRLPVLLRALATLEPMDLTSEHPSGEAALEALTTAYHAVLTDVAERYHAAKADGDLHAQLGIAMEVAGMADEHAFEIPGCAIALNTLYANDRITRMAYESSRAGARLINEFEADAIGKRVLN